MRHWKIHEAKARLSEVIKDAEHKGPQKITHSKPVAVVLSCEQYERLVGTGELLVAFMRRSPLHCLDKVDLTRDHNLIREVGF